MYQASLPSTLNVGHPSRQSGADGGAGHEPGGESLKQAERGSGVGSDVMAIPTTGADSGSVFLSYRREDTRHLAGRLYDRLAQRFGHEQTFMDVDSIEPGADFAA